MNAWVLIQVQAGEERDKKTVEGNETYFRDKNEAWYRGSL